MAPLMHPSFVAAAPVPFVLLEASQSIRRDTQTFDHLRPFTPTLFHLR
jgi:hypothetical protein